MLKAISKRLKKQDGFTLIELMVVVIILGILAAVAIPQFMGQAEKAKDQSARSEMRTIGTGIQLYYTENGKWPTAGKLSEIYTELEDHLGKESVPVADPWGGEYVFVDPNSEGIGIYDIYSPGKASGETIYWKEVN